MTYSPKKGDSKIAEKVKELSRLKYGRERAVVEKEISERFEIKKEGIEEETFLPEEPVR